MLAVLCKASRRGLESVVKVTASRISSDSIQRRPQKVPLRYMTLARLSNALQKGQTWQERTAGGMVCTFSKCQAKGAESRQNFLRVTRLVLSKRLACIFDD